MIQHPYWKGRRQQQQQTSLMIVGRLINSRDPLLCPLLSRLSFAFLYFHPWHHVPEIGFPFFFILFPSYYYRIHRIYIYIERERYLRCSLLCWWAFWPCWSRRDAEQWMRLSRASCRNIAHHYGGLCCTLQGIPTRNGEIPRIFRS